MIALTGETVKSAVVKAIISGFSVIEDEQTIKPTVYKEFVSQGFKKPSFFVKLVNVTQESYRIGQSKRAYAINVRYHSEKESGLYEELSRIGNALICVLRAVEIPIWLGALDSNKEPIEANLDVLGYDLEYRIEEGVLQFYVTYNLPVKLYKESKDPMTDLEINTHYKEVE